MDEEKRSARPIIKYLVFGSVGLFLVFAAYGAFVFWQTQTIEDPKKCFTTKMYGVNLCPSNPQYIRFKKVPKHFFQALILSEDGSFYSHKGFDWFEIKESFRRNFLEWRFARGGSTLTQQLAKNMYLSKEKSISRKFKEFFIAKQIEEKLSKTQILEKYINVVEFGDEIYGLKPASQHYFKKAPEYLNVLESIFLVSLLPSPKRLGQSYQTKTLSKSNLWRMKIILERMYRTGKIKDDVFVYIKMLLEDNAWPFDQYSESLFEPLTIEEQLFEEFEEMDKNDEVFLEATDEDVAGEPINELEPLDTETSESTETSEEQMEGEVEGRPEEASEVFLEEESEEDSSESKPLKDKDLDELKPLPQQPQTPDTTQESKDAA